MKTTLTVDIDYNPEKTDPEGLACAMDRLLETALSIPEIMDEYGTRRVGEFFVMEADRSRPKPGPTAGITLPSEPDEELEVRRRWVLYDPDTDALLTTRVYASYEDAADDASQVNDVRVLPLVSLDIIVRPDVQPAQHDPEEPDHVVP